MSAAASGAEMAGRKSGKRQQAKVIMKLKKAVVQSLIKAIGEFGGEKLNQSEKKEKKA